ncbi:integrin alpha-8-like [Penaeus indicus]|uniref:integrin alpha-8-like n=1 Tax=Penaeus indicus TaxID=29960 RepID=UPI00300D52C7
MTWLRRCSKTAMVTMVILIVTTEKRIHAFNLNTTMARVGTGPPDSDFGFSVALWSDFKGEKSVVVGAPKGANATISEGKPPMGNIFICDLQEMTCEPDPRLPSVSDSDKSKPALELPRPLPMAFGQTLSTLNRDSSHLAACAPNYPRLEGVYQIRGACFVLEDRTATPSKIIMFNATAGKDNTFQNASAGFSAQLFSKGDVHIVTGGPTAYYLEGVVNVKKLSSRGVGSVNRFTNSTFNMSSDPTYNLEGTYEGWQVAADKFDGEEVFVAASLVNFGKYTGMVKFYPTSLKRVERTLEGRETGAKFGYSLASGDFDGDGVSDLAVGSPLCRGEKKTDDAGGVSVFYSPLKKSASQKEQEIKGQIAWARFGLALTSLGDVNADGYDDLAVGAPYEDDRGAVYIFNGGSSGLLLQPSQVLRASDFPGNLRGFGFSLDGGVDMDENGYTDMAIGALGAESAVLVRSAPVVTLVGNFSFESDSIFIEDKQCGDEVAGYKSKRGTCVSLSVQMAYEAKTSLGNLAMLFRLTLDGQGTARHHVFYSNNEHRYERTSDVPYGGKPLAWKVIVFSKSNQSVTNQALRASLSVYLLPPSESEGREDVVPPVLNALSPTNFSASVVFTCKSDATCFSKPELTLGGSAETLIVGKDKVDVSIQLRVRNQSAHAVKIRIQHPTPLKYLSARGQGVRPPDCRYQNLISVQNPTSLLCTFRTIDVDDEVNFTLVFTHDPESLMNLLERSTLSVNLTATSDGVDSTSSLNNGYSIAIPTALDSVLHTGSASETDTISVKVNQSSTMNEIEEARAQDIPVSVERLGPQMQHEFILENRGPSPVKNTKLELLLPIFASGRQVTYLYQQPIIFGPVNCSTLPINPLSLEPPGHGNYLPTPPHSALTQGEKTAFVALQPEEGQSRSKRAAEEPTTTDYPTTEYLYSDYYTDYQEYYYYNYNYYGNAPLSEGQDTPDTIPKNDRTKPQSQDDALHKLIFCDELRCRITCDIALLPAEEKVKIIIPSYIAIRELDQLGYRKFRLLSAVRVNVTQKNNTLINPIAAAETFVSLISPKRASFDSIPLWILMLAVLFALVIILLIIAGLWRAGFFKRNRPPTGEKRESLIHQDFAICRPDTDLDEFQPPQNAI